MSANIENILVYLKNNLLFEILCFCLYLEALICGCLFETIKLSLVWPHRSRLCRVIRLICTEL